MEKKRGLALPTAIIVVLCVLILLVIFFFTFIPMFFGSSEIEPVSSVSAETSGEETVAFDNSSDTTLVEAQTVSETTSAPEIYPVDSSCSQYIFACCSGSNVTLTLYEKVDDKWTEQLVVQGFCGVNGITYNKTDGDSKTPAGEFDLTFCYGISKPDTKLNFEWVDTDTVWVNDPESSYYNTIQSRVIDGAWKSAESLYDGYFEGGEHNYCINIAVNGDGLTENSAIPGKGSMITICGKSTQLGPTQGCIDISAADMLSVLSHLDSSKNPEIIIY